MMQKKSLDIWKIASILIFVFFLIFLVYPIVNLLIQAVQDPGTGGFTLKNFEKFFGQSYYFTTLKNSLKVSSVATVLTLILGTSLAYFYSLYEIKGAKFLRILIILASMSAPFIGAYSWILLLGRNGIFTNFFKNLGIQIPDIYGFGGILLVFTLQLYPLIFLYVSGAFRDLDASLLEASESMGCKGIRRFFKIILPLIMPTMLAGALLVFMSAMSDFGTPMLIGEGYRTFTVLIYTEFLSEMGGDTGFASAIAVVAILFTTIVFLIQKYLSAKSAYATHHMMNLQRKKMKGWKNVLMHIYIYVVIAFSILPQIFLVYMSFKNVQRMVIKEGFSLNNYKEAFARTGNSIRNTLMLPAISLVIILILSVFIAYLTVRRRNVINSTIDVISMIPYIVPGVVIGIALLNAFATGIGNTHILAMGGTIYIVIISFVIRRLPYTIRSATASLQQIPLTTEEAALSLGASKFKTFYKVTVPMMARGVMAGAILSWVTLISELSTSILLTNIRTQTMTVAIYTEVIRGNYGIAAALSTILTVITVLSLILFLKVDDQT